jgi:hypothetical protein
MHAINRITHRLESYWSLAKEKSHSSSLPVCALLLPLFLFAPAKVV